MPTIDPVRHALVAADSAAADALGAPNYDEFQSDREVWELLQERPASVLRVSMPHCAVATPEEIGEDGSAEALARAAKNMSELRNDPRTRRLSSILWVYEITPPERPEAPQIGLGGMARTREIRTPQNPGGTIIRNEGIREPKARARARLTEATRADLGMVNLAVDDESGALQDALQAHARRNTPSFETPDEAGNRHRVWLVTKELEDWKNLLAREPQAYVADGNHRSAAAAMLGYEHFLTVFFPARTMTIAPYNRLIAQVPAPTLPEALKRSFDVTKHAGSGAFQPSWKHEIGLYDGRAWWLLRPRPGTFDPADAAQDIDADIVQRKLFAEVLGIGDARDERITYVGANRDAAWLQAEVDSGRFACAVTLAPVTMEQFINVCRQNRLMPPKSTWFVPKARTGLVIALLD
ncbi:MAG: DUF1015 family protein [Betaproteobacteria bacterium]|nr:MAG: DUF1015 family protein [Betaproteobacteria bacterium]